MMGSPVEGALEEARKALEGRVRSVLGRVVEGRNSFEDIALIMDVADDYLAAARSGHDGLRGDRRLVELYGQWSEEYYAASFYIPTHSSIEEFVQWLTLRRAAAPAALQDYELAMLDMLPAEARALSPDPEGGA